MNRIHLLIIRVKELLEDQYFKHNKKIYICCECGYMEIPYSYKKYNGLVNSFGWKKLKNPKRWVCHYCAYHKNTNEEWNNIVKQQNKKVRKTI